MVSPVAELCRPSCSSFLTSSTENLPPPPLTLTLMLIMRHQLLLPQSASWRLHVAGLARVALHERLPMAPMASREDTIGVQAFVQGGLLPAGLPILWSVFFVKIKRRENSTLLTSKISNPTLLTSLVCSG